MGPTNHRAIQARAHSQGRDTSILDSFPGSTPDQDAEPWHSLILASEHIQVIHTSREGDTSSWPSVEFSSACIYVKSDTIPVHL